MANRRIFSSSSSSSSSSSVTHDSWTHEVFLSFRGEDTRTNFTDHLYKALSDQGIITFIDRELTRGEEMSPAFLKAIEESRFSLIVFSENYASSRWCLDELVKILQCKERKQQIVLPIFYKVDPSHVRNQTKSYRDAFAEHNCRYKDNMEKVLKWRNALREAANLSGHIFKDGDPVGIQSRIQGVEKLLDVGGKGRRMVGIWGTSGIGKTTIAKVVYNAIAHQFEGSCFLVDVRENLMPHNGGLIQLQETLLHEILGAKRLKIVSADKGMNVIQKQLSHKKILLILDDVNQLEQLDNLAGVGWFGEGSRVIITTQDSGLLKCHGIELIYKVQKLCGDQALELFSLNAFGSNKPPNDYLELTQRAIAYAQGLPLALTLLGSHLRNKGVHRWQAVLLDGYGGDSYTSIQKILRKSYDALKTSVQQVFLDIACFFKGEDKDYVLQIVSKVLIEKAMITIQSNMILMHDLLEQLGKDIVHEESSNDPGKRSRLWFHQDVFQVLTENTGTRKIKGIMVKCPKPNEIPLILNEKSLSRMVNLEIFINPNAVLSRCIDHLPNELRLIDWGRCQLQFFPSNFHARHLVVFNMPCSDIRQLEIFKNCPNVTSINLSGCEFLEKISDLSGIPTIKFLNLSECTSLVEVHDSVGFLDKLVKLDLRECVKLTRFATRLRLKSLKSLCVRNCQRLESFPEIEDEMECLTILNMDGSGIRELPSSIVNLTRLQELRGDHCENLTVTSLGSVCGLQHLTDLSFKGCRKLLTFRDKVKSEVSSSNTKLQQLLTCVFFYLHGCNFSESDFLVPLGCWNALTELDLSGNNFVTLPGCISNFVNLLILRLHGCKRLREIPEVLPPTVAWLYLPNCTALENFPKLTQGVWWLDLVNCFRLRGIVTENIFLNQLPRSVSKIILPGNEVEIILPGNEVPKWFRCCKDATVVEVDLDSDEERVAGCEVCFEIPPNVKWQSTLSLLLCVSYHDPYYFHAKILINGKLINEIWVRDEDPTETQETHMWLKCISLSDLNPQGKGRKTPMQQGNTNTYRFQVIFNFPDPDGGPIGFKTCGVHLLGHQVQVDDDE
ncbi:TMV resistance protein N-like [Prunus avium]|uniref:TMV resistance protein N-like n=1 Tax=Prunus avium TaxID=42229 RepID=A0A6P5TZW6_PRUAV|nr:TMV resistance protein N-like [Prunus avium]